MKTCTTNLKEHVPDSYPDITHTTIADMLANDGFINKVHTMQIPTCHQFASICIETRETLLKFTNNEYSILPNHPITFQPDDNDKIRIWIENLPIELPDKEVKTFLSKYTTPVGKTYYPGTKPTTNSSLQEPEYTNVLNLPNTYQNISIKLIDTYVFALMISPKINNKTYHTQQQHRYQITYQRRINKKHHNKKHNSNKKYKKNNSKYKKLN